MDCEALTQGRHRFHPSPGPEQNFPGHLELEIEVKSRMSSHNIPHCLYGDLRRSLLWGLWHRENDLKWKWKWLSRKYRRCNFVCSLVKMSTQMESLEGTLSETWPAVLHEVGQDCQTQLRLIVDLEQTKLAPVFPNVLHSYIPG